MRLSIAGLWLALLILSWQLCAMPRFASAEPAAKALSEKESKAARADKAAKFAAQLGSEHFATREKASQGLLKLGIEGVAALKKSSQSLDPEVRYRSERLLILVSDQDFDLRLKLFAADKRNQRDYGLPGWKQYRKIVGEDAVAKQLFVSMQKNERKLLEAFELDPKTAAATIQDRSTFHYRNLRDSGEVAAIGSIAALLLGSSLTDIPLDHRSMEAVTNLCGRSSEDGMFASSNDAKPLRKLLAAWVTSSKNEYALSVILISIQNNLPEGSQVARRVLENPERIRLNVPFTLSYAMIALALTGGEIDLPLLEKQLSNEKYVTSRMGKAPNQQIHIQVRGVALAALVIMTKQSPKDYGFETIKPNNPYLFELGSLGFESEEKRAAAIEKWRAYRQKQKKNIQKKPVSR